MARQITKGLIGLEDISIGTSTFTRATSTGGTLTLHQINSTNLGSGFPVNTSSPVVAIGAVNGINTVFTLPTAPGLMVLVFRNGVLQRGGGIDYTLAGSTVTFVAAPLGGDNIYLVY